MQASDGKKSLHEKITEIYHKLHDRKRKLAEAEDHAKREKHTAKIDKLLKKLIKKKRKLYKHEIRDARKLKQNGILIPLAPGDEGCVFTDEVSAYGDLQALAEVNRWRDKVLWIDLEHEEERIIRLS